MEIVNTVNKTMSSRDIAETTGKRHQDIMRAIRNMEEAWSKVNGCKFALVDYTDAKGEKRPEYQLTKKECLYIATKFNDESRAILINRWEELEQQQQFQVPTSMAEALRLAANQAEQIHQQQQLLIEKDNALISAGEMIEKARPKVEYCERVLQSTTNITTNIIAQELGITAIALNKALRDRGIQYKQGQKWLLSAKYRTKGYAVSQTYTYRKSNGEEGTDIQLRWTERGRAFIHHLFNN